MSIMCVILCLFSALSCRVGALQISIIIIVKAVHHIYKKHTQKQFTMFRRNIYKNSSPCWEKTFTKAVHHVEKKHLQKQFIMLKKKHLQKQFTMFRRNAQKQFTMFRRNAQKQFTMFRRNAQKQFTMFRRNAQKQFTMFRRNTHQSGSSCTEEEICKSNSPYWVGRGGRGGASTGCISRWSGF